MLFWGILGAILMRALFIASGVTLLNRFQWVTYLFGAFIVYTGNQTALPERGHDNPADSLIARFALRHLRLTEILQRSLHRRRNGVRYFTTLALVLMVMEITDVIFAVDSIPAVLAVTRQPYIVFTSNIFAILGLRATLFCSLPASMDLFHQFNYGLGDHPRRSSASRCSLRITLRFLPPIPSPSLSRPCPPRWLSAWNRSKTAPSVPRQRRPERDPGPE